MRTLALVLSWVMVIGGIVLFFAAHQGIMGTIVLLIGIYGVWSRRREI